MVAGRSVFLFCLAFSLVTLVQRGSGDPEDTLKETSSLKLVQVPLAKTTILSSTGLSWHPFENQLTISMRERWDHVSTTTKRPGTTRAPAKPAASDFDLADALDDWSDRDDGHRKPSVGGGGFSDKDLEDILGGGDYNPDKGRGDGRHNINDDPEAGMSPETGTIAGVASALAMALIGAVSSYISYQQKKFCFRIQQGLNADYVKGENLEAVVCEEPQVKYLELPPQSSEPPQPQPPRI
ncbi:CD99 antigen-like protein 2 isoform X2 [Desmodus rotundus]|uniref:CD99 antigen-like protein 2 isoform X2 n=1 Tax=Desmodus rotundus TaxID=9430 RepID=UPI002381568C|nr:CD99 antigen-like protein 2 isoform X2 [Desmodus rotundus]